MYRCDFHDTLKGLLYSDSAFVSQMDAAHWRASRASRVTLSLTVGAHTVAIATVNLAVRWLDRHILN
ncbi:hypothetical protein QBD00_001876 [Ochrobactrum sp. AN78]|jgi:hypothetical protein|nr:hypothetical protein [Ochrobactrum sp. AN78]